MEEESVTEPLNIDKDIHLIKSAQKDIGLMDVLVCGSCHEVFHFVEQFQQHKLPDGCVDSSTMKENCKGETKPQVWAFVLWKNAHYKNNTNDGTPPPSSWEIYQRWCKLDTKEKDAWILAGKSLQTSTKLSEAKLIEVKVKPQLFGRRQKVMVTVPSLTTGNKTNTDDPLDEGEIRLSQLPEAQRIALKAQAEVNKVSDDADPLGETTDAKQNEDMKANDLIKRGIIKPVQLNSDVTILPSNKKQNSKETSKTTSDGKKTDEYAVEKIVSKRYNPRKKTFEYLVKWEDSDKNEYTWEPTANLESCKALVDEYEANLKKQRLQKAEAANLQRQYEKKKQKANSLNMDILEGRPQRSSKQKALNQVKAWCGDISDADDETTKRKYSDDDSDSDSFEKKIKMEEDNTDSEDDKPTVTIRKVQKPSSSSLNGVGGSSKRPPPIGKILIPDSKGIVRINQKQASELSSGVYIMSKTAGIIKLDSNTSKFATSGGQAIVKVEPRIGQTQIKVVKRDHSTNTVKLTPKPKITLKSITKTKKDVIEKKSTLTVTEKKDSVFPQPDKDEESDDGIPELEFPTDLPLPEPDSPPGDFILDPETGKIAGQEYPEEAEVIINEEMKRIDSSECSGEKVKEEPTGKPEDGLENLVKLAAADILDDELSSSNNIKEESKVDTEKSTISSLNEEEKITTILPVIAAAAATTVPLLKSKPVITNVSASSSILQRKLLSTPRQVNPNTTTTTIRKVATSVSPLKRDTPVISPVRSRIITTKPKQQYTPVNTPTISRVRQSYSNKNMNVHKKIGQTTIYRTVQKPTKTSGTHQIIHPQTIIEQQQQQQLKQQQQQQQPQEQEPSPVILAAPTEENQLSSTPASQAVINMPLLNADETISSETQQPANEQLTNLSSLTELNETETPLIITGEDGTIYQVAGQDEQGQTILISQGADGQSQCLVVATESLEVEENQVIQMNEGVTELHEPMIVGEPETETGSTDAEESMVAQMISADPPSPGGRRNVTVMLPDGSCVTMVVTQEQYESLELDK